MTLHAGAAVCEINPHASTALYGYPHVERISTGVHDPLLATAVVLKNRGRTVVLASLDLLMIEPPTARQFRQAVADAVGCNATGVFISCTHTHSAPVTSRLIGWQNDATIPPPGPAYLEFVEKQLVASAVAAAESAVAAELAWTSADAAGVGGNRLDRAGVTDPACGVLAVRRAGDSGLLAMTLIYGMHPTVLHEDSTLVSADFPYYTRRHIAGHVGCDVPIAYHTAPCGNQSPRHFVDRQTFAEAERLGRALGAAVCDALDGLGEDDWRSEVPLAGKLAAVDLPRNPIRPLPQARQLLADARARYEQLRIAGAPRAEVRTAECAVFGAEGTLALAQAEQCGEIEARLREYGPAEVQALRIGEAWVVGLPGECFVEYALDIKRRASRPAWVVSLVNGDLQGYIVTPEAAEAGGYEAANAVFAPAAGDVLVRVALELID